MLVVCICACIICLYYLFDAIFVRAQCAVCVSVRFISLHLFISSLRSFDILEPQSLRTRRELAHIKYNIILDMRCCDAVRV